MKTLKCINYQQGKILVDEQVEISIGLVWLHNRKIITSVTKGEVEFFNLQNKKVKQYSQIIAQTPNLNLEGIPFIELEDELTRIKYRLMYIAANTYNEELQQLANEAWRLVQAAQPKKYTEDDLREAIEMAQEQKSRRFYPNEYEFTYTPEQIIQSLQPKIEIESVEVVMHLSDKGKNGFEYVTYQKDGRTYLKVTKINYA